MASLIVVGPFLYTLGAILLLLISPFRKILIFAGCESKSQCLASFLNLWIKVVSVSESFCCISINLEVYMCMLALFRRLQSCSLMWVQGWFSCSFMRSHASPLAFPFATTTLSSSTMAAAFSTPASQSSSLCPCLPSNISMSFRTDMLNWCLLLLLLSVVFIKLLLFHINVLDRSRIPATSSLMSLDMLHASLCAWSSSLQRCLISSSWLAELRLCLVYRPCWSPGAP